MPAKKGTENSTSKSPKKERWNDVKFVNYELSKDEREALKALPLWDDDWNSRLDRALDAGYRITLRYDDYSHANAAFMSISDGKSENAGVILTGRGSIGIKALRQVLFKHWDLADQEWNRLDRSLNEEIDD